MRFAFRFVANAIAFYLGMYLIDTLIAPYFYIRHYWIAIVLAFVLGAANSTHHPFRGYRTNRSRAFGFFGLTVLANYLVLQIMALIFASLGGNPLGIVFAAGFLTLLAALLNQTVGFKPIEQPKVVTREPGMSGISDSTKERMLQVDSKSRRKRERAEKRRDTEGS